MLQQISVKIPKSFYILLCHKPGSVKCPLTDTFTDTRVRRGESPVTLRFYTLTAVSQEQVILVQSKCVTEAVVKPRGPDVTQRNNTAVKRGNDAPTWRTGCVELQSPQPDLKTCFTTIENNYNTLAMVETNCGDASPQLYNAL